ncbi:MAG TPA: hypothetical protein VGF12_07000 [Roseateles sp.]
MDYVLDRPPFTRYHWNGAAMVASLDYANSADAQPSPLVTPAGRAAASEVRTVAVEAALQQTLFNQLPNGNYIGTAALPESVGFYGSKLFLASGPLSNLVPVGQNATLASVLKTSAGATITNGTLTGAWALPDGNLLFTVNSNGGATSGRAFLYYGKVAAGAITAATLTVGNNAAAFDNGCAVLDIGNKGGAQTADIRILHDRSICIATIAGNTVLFLSEYNVAGGRVQGGANDQCRVWRSTDLGKTWAIFLEFNTDGANRQVRHGHGVVQDPATGFVYFLFGDDPTSGIIRWDGSAAAPPANTAMPDFNKFAGWHALSRLDALTDNYRAGDLVFGGDIGAYLTDRSGAKAFWPATAVSRTGPLVATKGRDADMSPGRDPLIGIAIPGGGALWISMWDSSVPGGVRGYDVWSSPDLRNWFRVGWLSDVGVAGVVGVLFNVFWTSENKIVVSLASGSARLAAGANSFGGSLVLNADGFWDGVTKALS